MLRLFLSLMLSGLGLVGPEDTTDGDFELPRSGISGSIVVSQLHGKFFEQSYRGNVFSACQTAGVLLTQVGTAFPSFAIYNPKSSGNLVSLIRADMVLTALAVNPIRVAFVLGRNTSPRAPTGGTIYTPIPAIVGGTATTVTQVTSGSSLGSGFTADRCFVSHFSSSVGTTNTNMPGFFMEFDGNYVLMPGTAVCFGQTNNDTTTNSTALCDFVWEEIPI